jgi:hypothetical protein
MPSSRTRASGSVTVPDSAALLAAPETRNDHPAPAGRTIPADRMIPADRLVPGDRTVLGDRMVPGGAGHSLTVRHAAVDAPVLLLVYGLLRLVDGLDGSHGQGLASDFAYLALFGSMVLFGVLAAAVRPLVPAGARPLAAFAAAATVAGTACFLWTLVSTAIAGVTRPAEPLRFAGPLLFSLGMLTLLGLLVASRHAPAWSPLLFGAGIVAVLIDADSLPPAALILLAALAPLARPTETRTPSTRPAETSQYPPG